jgi:hypothetical protein
MGILVEIEVEIWFPDHIDGGLLGWKSEARRVATFLAIMEGHGGGPPLPYGNVILSLGSLSECRGRTI